MNLFKEQYEVIPLKDFLGIYPPQSKEGQFLSRGGKELLTPLLELENETRAKEIIAAILNIAVNGLFEADDIHLMVDKFSYAPTHPSELASKYKLGQSKSSWQRDESGHITISFHDGMAESVSSAEDIALSTTHYVGHELAHSILQTAIDEQLVSSNSEIEEADLDDLNETTGSSLQGILDDISSKIENIDIMTESPYILHLDKNAPNLLKIERMADVLGAYIASSGNKDNFITRRLKNIENPEIFQSFFVNETELSSMRSIRTEELSEKGKEWYKRTNNLFDNIHSNWQEMMVLYRKAKTTLDSDALQFTDTFFDPVEQSMSGTFDRGSSGNNEKSMPTNSKPTAPAPGAQPQHTSGLWQSLFELTKAIADEGNILKSVSG